MSIFFEDVKVCRFYSVDRSLGAQRCLYFFLFFFFFPPPFFFISFAFGFPARTDSPPAVTTLLSSEDRDPDLFPQFTVGCVYTRAQYQAKIEELSDRVTQAEVEVFYLLCREAELKRQVDELDEKVRKATVVLRKSR